MSAKDLEALIAKTIKKVIKKEIGKLKLNNLPVVLNQTNHPLDTLVENGNKWNDQLTTEDVIDDIYTSRYVTINSKDDAELERNLRELKFKQELRKDWISFLVRDVIVYSATVIFIFAAAGFYLFTLIHRY